MCKSPTKSQECHWGSPQPGLLFAAGTTGHGRGSGFEILQFFAGSVLAVHSDPSHSLGEGFPDLL